MGFNSQFKHSQSSSPRGGGDIVITQNIKNGTKTEEMSIRVSTTLLTQAKINIGDKVDILWDEENGLWRIQKQNRGYSITGKDGSPTHLIRYTLKNGHHKLTDDVNELPKKLSFDTKEVEVDAINHSITFCEIFSLI